VLVRGVDKHLSSRVMMCVNDQTILLIHSAFI